MRKKLLSAACLVCFSIMVHSQDKNQFPAPPAPLPPMMGPPSLTLPQMTDSLEAPADLGVSTLFKSFWKETEDRYNFTKDNVLGLYHQGVENAKKPFKEKMNDLLKPPSVLPLPPPPPLPGFKSNQTHVSYRRV